MAGCSLAVQAVLIDAWFLRVSTHAAC
jgi:hypothetical protein